MAYEREFLLESVLKLLRDRAGCSLGYIEGHLGVSGRTLQKVILALTGKQFKVLREEVLIDKVRTLIRLRPTVAIKEISFAAGYASPRSFSRAIKRACGLSPVAFRSLVASEIIGTKRNVTSVVEGSLSTLGNT
jgi:AraC-like DNA-binding protein